MVGDGVDVIAAAEGSASVLLLVLPLLATPVLDGGLFVTVSEVMCCELPLFPWPAVLVGIGTEAPRKEHACWANCMASVQMSAISRCTRSGAFMCLCLASLTVCTHVEKYPSTRPGKWYYDNNN